MVERRLTAIDLFSGAGGFSLAANNAKVDVLAAIELDEIAAETYYNNLVAESFMALCNTQQNK